MVLRCKSAPTSNPSCLQASLPSPPPWRHCLRYLPQLCTKCAACSRHPASSVLCGGSRPVRYQVLSSIPGLHLLNASSALHPSCGNQRWLQILPDCPGGPIIPPIENHCSVGIYRRPGPRALKPKGLDIPLCPPSYTALGKSP